MKIVQLLVSGTLAGLLGALLGCSSTGEPTSTTSTSSSTGGTGGGGGGWENCTWDGTGGGVLVPDCPTRFTTNIQGTLDGMPFNPSYTGTTWSGGPIPLPPDKPPYVSTIDLPALSYIQVEWESPDISRQFWPIVGGFCRFPGESTMRPILPGSMVRFKCLEPELMLILELDNGKLTVCSR